jgi:hypothetical protein
MWPWLAEIGNEHWAGDTRECHLASEWFSAPGRAANRELPLSCVGMFSRQMEIVRETDDCAVLVSKAARESRLVGLADFRIPSVPCPHAEGEGFDEGETF